MWLRTHKSGVVVCKASSPVNLHSKYGQALGLTDEYADSETDKFTGEPGDSFANEITTVDLAKRAKPSPAELLQQKVLKYNLKAARATAAADGAADVVAEIDVKLAKLP